MQTPLPTKTLQQITPRLYRSTHYTAEELRELFWLEDPDQQVWVFYRPNTAVAYTELRHPYDREQN